ncbi:GspH/FimT family pseudopilin [Janthinobacterium agaricidamnosum]|uniref:Type II secretion system protein H n=1 Tax=Janthinobacterium agaricidamnosum NBRC 102515 = DSM 9628 TaxID=1349767 RepID=W0VA15_9BURK|nr:GspH/FimT family pseudopilin [Janthinobacterium agaricidamnosum]CDG84425.1 prepilin-type N-terminal cleavage/methylation domain protein [Janthinobacterium agaricidamnosum NBRC 102515 = DSM 9628]
MKTISQNQGFTLLELMVVLLIAAVLGAAGTLSMRDMVARQQLRTTTNDLFAAIDLTRSLAIARGSRVMLMPLDPGGVDWSQGWVIFADRNGNSVFDDADELIVQQGPVASGITISSVFSSGHAPFYIAYNGAGRSCSANNSMAARWGTLSVVLGKRARHIKINMLGRVRVCDPQETPATCSGVAES